MFMVCNIFSSQAIRASGSVIAAKKLISTLMLIYNNLLSHPDSDKYRRVREFGGSRGKRQWNTNGTRGVTSAMWSTVNHPL